MYTYDKLFSEYHHNVAQILLTASDVEQTGRRENFHNTLSRLLELQALPIINENDTVATEEIKVGDNDTLSALVSVSISADLLILLSDIDGLFTADPHIDPNAKLIKQIDEIGPEILALAGDTSSGLGTGGMKTKLSAAEICLNGGCDMVIANGANPKILYDIINDNDPTCTRFKSGR
jgi:glutamate 5-kinase